MALDGRDERQEQFAKAVGETVFDAVDEQLDEGGHFGAVVQRHLGGGELTQEGAARGLHVPPASLAHREADESEGADEVFTAVERAFFTAGRVLRAAHGWLRGERGWVGLWVRYSELSAQYLGLSDA